MSKRILITSEKDNIGKSLLSVKLALELQKNKQKVVIVEYTGKNKSIAEYFEKDESIIYDLKDVFNKVCDIDSSTINITENIDLLPCPRLKNKSVETDRENFKCLINLLSRIYNYIIVETSSVSKSINIDLECFDSYIIVNDNSFSSIREINNDLLVTNNSANLANKYIVVNKFNKKFDKNNKKLTMKDYERVFSTTELFFIPYDNNYNLLSKDNITDNRKDKLSDCILELAKKVL